MTQPEFSTGFVEELGRLLEWRRDVRHFRPEPVPETLLTHLLQSASIAPSVGLSQPWRFIRVDSAQRRKNIRDEFERCNAAAQAGLAKEDAIDYARLKLSGLDEAPHHIAVFCDLNPSQGRGLGRQTMPCTVQWSVVMAIYNFWLCATAQGVGVGWVSILEPAVMHRILSVDPSWDFIAYLCVGYPKETLDRPELEIKGWAARDPDRCAWIKR